MKLFQKLIYPLLVSFVLISCKGKGEWKPEPPFPGLEKQMTSYVINPQIDTFLTLSSGTTLFIPAGSLVNADGSEVRGDVELLYREFHDAFDVFLSGIHMDFYSMEQKRTFQTAGMFEINAIQGDSKLAIANGKAIDVRFGSKYIGNDYSFFYLNSTNGSWEWVDMPSYELNSEKVEAVASLKSRTPNIFMGDKYLALSYMGFLDIYLNNDWEKIYNLRTDAAVRKKLESYGVKIHDVSVYGEIRFGKSFYNPIELLWKDIDGKAFPQWLSKFSIQWGRDGDGSWVVENFRIKGLGENRYEFTFIDGRRVFSKQMEAVIPLKNLLKLPAEEWQRRYNEAMAELAKEQEKIDIMAESFRTFSVKRLGVFNFDALLKDEGWFNIEPVFTIGGIEITGKEVVIILGDNSGYLTYKPNQQTNLRINPESGHRIFLLLSSTELGWYAQNQLAEMNSDELRIQDRPRVEFTLEKYTVTDAVALREFMGF